MYIIIAIVNLYSIVLYYRPVIYKQQVVEFPFRAVQFVLKCMHAQQVWCVMA